MLDIIKSIINNITSLVVIFLILLSFIKKFKFLKISIVSIVILIFFSPLANIIVYKIEKINPPGNIDKINLDFNKIVILSGFEEIEKTIKYNQLYLGGTNNRIIEGTRLYKRFKKKIIFSGSSNVKNDKLRGAFVARRFFESFNIEKKNIIYDDDSKNTEDTFIFLRENFKNERHLIVTSALHMQRCKYLAEKNNLNYILYPVDYRANHENIYDFNFSIRDNLYLFHYGLREIAALIFYKLSKKI